MQIAARIGASHGDVTPGTSVASAVGALQELGLASLTSELRVGDFKGAGQQRSFPRRLAVCNAQRRCSRVSPGWMAIWLGQSTSPNSDFIAKWSLNPPSPVEHSRECRKEEEEACCVPRRRKKKDCEKFASFVIFSSKFV